MERRRLKPTTFKLTQAFVERATPRSDGKPRWLYDGRLTGFSLYVGKTKKTYYVEGPIKRNYAVVRYRKLKIGLHGHLTADEARTKAKQILGRMADGEDPAEASKEAEGSSLTLKAFFDGPFKEFKAAKHEDDMNGLRKTTLADYESRIDRAFKPWHRRLLGDISRDDVLRMYRRLSEEHSPSYATGSMRVLSSVLSLAVLREIIGSNPVRTIGEHKMWHRDEPRQTLIRPHQLPDWFEGLKTVRKREHPPSVGVGTDYLEFVLFTGLRKTESASLRWEYVDFDDKTLNIPRSRTKNKRPHTLPLTDHLLELLRRRKAEAYSSEWVFPSMGRKMGRGHISEPRYIADLVTEEYREGSHLRPQDAALHGIQGFQAVRLGRTV